MPSFYLPFVVDTRCLYLFSELQRFISLHGNSTLPSSLFAGQLGFALPLALHHKLYGDVSAMDMLHQLLKTEVSRCAAKDTTFCTGLSGLGWLLSFLQNSEGIEMPLENSFYGLDHYLMQDSLSQLRRGNYDYLGGGLGPALYFMERKPTQKIALYFKQLEKELDNVKTSTKRGFTWQSISDQKNSSFDLGLAHGVPSIIVLLSKLQFLQLGSTMGIELIEGGIEWIMTAKNNDRISQFPSAIEDDIQEDYSRLAWCYGDLCISNCLLIASMALNRNDLRMEAFSIVENTLNRLSEELSGVNDACICHGSSGLAYLYYRNYQEFNDDRFLAASNHWYEKTWEFNSPGTGVAGYQFWVNPEGEWADSIGLLEGTVGIGLSQMSIASKSNMHWDKCLLLR